VRFTSLQLCLVVLGSLPSLAALAHGGGHGTEYLDGEDFERIADSARLVLDHAAYHTCCPVCRGELDDDDCELCQGSGFITSATYDRLQEGEREWLST